MAWHGKVAAAGQPIPGAQAQAPLKSYMPIPCCPGSLCNA